MYVYDAQCTYIMPIHIIIIKNTYVPTLFIIYSNTLAVRCTTFYNNIIILCKHENNI